MVGKGSGRGEKFLGACVRKVNSGMKSADTQFGEARNMKKTRRTKRKLGLEWAEEKYSPLLVLRSTPHTGETKILPIHLLRQNSPPAEPKRPAA